MSYFKTLLEKSKVGEVCWWKPRFDKYGHAQAGERPVLILAWDENSPVTTVFPMTSKVKGAGYQLPVIFNNTVGIVLINQITTIDKEELENTKGRISDSDFQRVKDALEDYLYN